MTPTEKAMLTDRNCPLVSLLVFTCAAAAQPNSYSKKKKKILILSIKQQCFAPVVPVLPDAFTFLEPFLLMKDKYTN